MQVAPRRIFLPGDIAPQRIVRGDQAHGQRSHRGDRNRDTRLREARHDRECETGNQTMYCPPLIESVEPVMAPAWSAARNTTARAISSGSPRRPTGISGRMLFSSTSFGTACTISVLM